jgi:hypothetical protein
MQQHQSQRRVVLRFLIEQLVLPHSLYHPHHNPFQGLLA